MVSINLSTVVATIINFIILYAILRHFLFKPVNSFINTRQNEIKSDINKAKEDRDRAEDFKMQSENELKANVAKGKSIVEEYKVKAENITSDILKEAKSEADLIMERARIEADREREKVKDEIKNQVVDLAVLVSSKALEETIDEEKHKKLIEDFIAKVGT